MPRVRDILANSGGTTAGGSNERHVWLKGLPKLATHEGFHQRSWSDSTTGGESGCIAGRKWHRELRASSAAQSTWWRAIIPPAQACIFPLGSSLPLKRAAIQRENPNLDKYQHDTTLLPGSTFAPQPETGRGAAPIESK